MKWATEHELVLSRWRTREQYLNLELRSVLLYCMTCVKSRETVDTQDTRTQRHKEAPLTKSRRKKEAERGLSCHKCFTDLLVDQLLEFICQEWEMRMFSCKMSLWRCDSLEDVGDGHERMRKGEREDERGPFWWGDLHAYTSSVYHTFKKKSERRNQKCVKSGGGKGPFNWLSKYELWLSR